MLSIPVAITLIVLGLILFIAADFKHWQNKLIQSFLLDVAIYSIIMLLFGDAFIKTQGFFAGNCLVFLLIFGLHYFAGFAAKIEDPNKTGGDTISIWIYESIHTKPKTQIPPSS